jgi:hypothetical protein
LVINAGTYRRELLLWWLWRDAISGKTPRIKLLAFFPLMGGYQV